MVHIKRPSPATVLASIALLVSLSGTAIAAGAVPLAKKALFAKNAGKLQGKTARQVAAIPGPATSLNGLTRIASCSSRRTPRPSTGRPLMRLPPFPDPLRSER